MPKPNFGVAGQAEGLNGAEAEWYTARRRPTPRNGALADLRELRWVRGFEDLLIADSLIGVDHDPMPLTHTPIPVLRLLDGLTPEALYWIERRRAARQTFTNLEELGARLSSVSRASLMAHMRSLQTVLVPTPDAWVLTTRVEARGPSVKVRLVRAGDRVAVNRFRVVQ